jgi:hypothetical protein
MAEVISTTTNTTTNTVPVVTPVSTTTTQTTTENTSSVTTNWWNSTTVTQRLDLISKRTNIEVISLPHMRTRSVITLIAGAYKPSSTLNLFLNESKKNELLYSLPKIRLTNPSDPLKKFIDYNVADTKTDNMARRTSSKGSYDTFTRGELVDITSGATSYTAIAAFDDTVQSTRLLSVVNIMNSSNVHVGDNTNPFSTGTWTVTGRESKLSATIGGYTPKTLVNPETGTRIKSSVTGTFAGIIDIPANSVANGTYNVFICDADDGGVPNATTRAIGSYESFGLLNRLQDFIVLQRNQDVATAGGAWTDPLAQTFVVPAEFTKGIFLTALDLYFYPASTSLTSKPTEPVTVQIVEVENGYPSNRIVPYGAVTKSSAEINYFGNLVLQNGGAFTVTFDQGITAANILTKVTDYATKFTFPSLVYLRPNTEYAIKVLTDSNRWKVWISSLEKETIDDDGNHLFGLPTSEVMSSQPYLGSLFKSQNNSTWTATQFQDLAFTLYRAKFSTGKTGRVVMSNPLDIGETTIASDPFKLTSGSKKVLVNHRAHGLVSGHKVTYSGATDSNGQSFATFNTQFTVVAVVNQDAYVIELPTEQTTTDTVGGDFVTVKKTKEFSFNKLHAIDFAPPGTTIDYAVRTSTAKAVGTEFVNFSKEQDLFHFEPKYLHSSVNATTFISSPEQMSVEVAAGLSSNDDSVSPVVMIDNIVFEMGTNRINNQNRSSIDRDVCYNVVFSGFGGEFVSSDEEGITTFYTEQDVSNFTNGAYVKIIGTQDFDTNDNDVKVVKVINDAEIKMVVFDRAINATSSGATGPSTEIREFTHVIDEISPNNGTAFSKYITKEVRLEQPATSIRMLLASAVSPKVEANCTYEIYFRGKSTIEGVSLKSKNWKKVNYVPQKSSVGFTDFVDQVIQIEDLESFDSFQVKIVMLSNIQSYVPKFKDLRIIALA